ncbi:unnamed protein product [Rotaria socialis]|uniref:Uncharacterized protein n=1 Tax=Rotaria socialis TaxID=392032 RepID=A0A818IMT4_9BILA|nr:unnamed protein product [Rotaria socialis]
MQYAQENEKVATIASSGIMISQPLPLNKDLEIRLTRIILLIMLGVSIGAAVLGVLGAIASIASNDVQYGSKYSIRQTGIGQSLISLLLYSFGYLVAYRYSQTGLRVFAWINIFALASAGIGLVVRMIFGFLVLTTPTSTDHGQLILASLSVFLFFVVIIIIACFVYQIVIIKHAFKLARLIEAKKSLFFQQI